MDGIVVDRLGYVYMVSNSEYSEFKYTNIDISSTKMPTNGEIIYKKISIDNTNIRKYLRLLSLFTQIIN